jgi:hypothetical protein
LTTPSKGGNHDESGKPAEEEGSLRRGVAAEPVRGVVVGVLKEFLGVYRERSDGGTLR